MAGKSNDQIAFGDVSDHDYLKALIIAGVLPATVVPGFVAADIEGTGSAEPGFDTAGRAFKEGDPRRDEDASDAEVAAREDIRGDNASKEATAGDPERELEQPVSVAVEDGGPPGDPEDAGTAEAPEVTVGSGPAPASATPAPAEDATATEDTRTVEELQDELRAEGKPVSGTKAELIARLEE